MRRISTNTYSGQHGLWYVATGQFARWATMNLTLLSGGRLSGRIANDPREPIAFTRVAPMGAGRW